MLEENELAPEETGRVAGAVVVWLAVALAFEELGDEPVKVGSGVGFVKLVEGGC